MVLSDKDIKAAVKAGIIGINPYFEKDVQPASVDLHLDKKLLIFNNSSAPFIDLKKELPNINEQVIIDENDPFIIHPGDFVLGSTLEKISIPNNMVARIEGKSSLGRIGLLIHSTAGFVDPGFDGNLTLELRVGLRGEAPQTYFSNVNLKTQTLWFCSLNQSSNFS